MSVGSSSSLERLLLASACGRCKSWLILVCEPGSYAPKRFQEGIRDNVQMLKELHDLRDRPVQPARVLRQLSLEV